MKIEFVAFPNKQRRRFFKADHATSGKQTSNLLQFGKLVNRYSLRVDLLQYDR